MVLFSRYLRDKGLRPILPYFLEVAHRLDKRLSAYDYDEIDGIEVLFAAKTPGQVCAGIRGGVEIRAKGAEKTEVAFTFLPGDLEMTDERGDLDLVSKVEKLSL